jgi:hypothetical protein
MTNLSLTQGLPGAPSEPVLDRFFVEVLVMAEDPNVRRNRIALLQRLWSPRVAACRPLFFPPANQNVPSGSWVSRFSLVAHTYLLEEVLFRGGEVCRNQGHHRWGPSYVRSG